MITTMERPGLIGAVKLNRKSGAPKRLKKKAAEQMMRFGDIVLPFPTAEEAAAALIANGQFPSVTKRMIQETFGIKYAEEVNEIYMRALDLLERRSNKSRAQHAVDSLNFYLFLAADLRAGGYVRLTARERVDKLLGLDLAARAALEGEEKSANEATAGMALTKAERDEVEMALSATMRKALERRRTVADQRLVPVEVQSETMPPTSHATTEAKP